MLFYEVRHFRPKRRFFIKFVCGYFYWLANNICKKKSSLLTEKLVEKNPFQTLLKLKLKKMAWTTNSLGRGGKTLVVRLLKKKLRVSSLGTFI